MLPDESLELLKEIRDAAKANPEHVKAVTEVVLKNNKDAVKYKLYRRPTGWSKLTNAPYYKEVYAIQLRDTVIDKMLTSREDWRLDYKDNPTISKNSLQNKVLQAFLYLSDHLDLKTGDPEHPNFFKYTIMRNAVEVCKESMGIAIRWKDKYEMKGSEVAPLGSAPIAKRKEVADWRSKLAKWLENAEMDTKYEDRKVNLSPEDIEELEMSLHGLEDIHAKITSDRILILKTKEAQ